MWPRPRLHAPLFPLLRFVAGERARAVLARLAGLGWRAAAGLTAGLAVLAAGVLTALALSGDAMERERKPVFFTIATGSVAGVYFPVGGLIASVISHPEGENRCEETARCGPQGLTAAAQVSEGSVRNVRLVNDGRVQSGLAQADIVSLAYRGQGPFLGNAPATELRAIANLYPEVMHLVVRKDAGITGLEDLAGKRLSIDAPGSGTHTNARLLIDALGLAPEQLPELSFTNPDRSADRLLDGEIDGFFFVAGAPVRTIWDLAKTGEIALVPIAGPAADAVREAQPYLSSARIAEDAYPGLPPVQTLSVGGALWIVSADVDEALVYGITQALWHPANRALFREAGPEGRLLDIRTATAGVPIPFHPGAERYYIERNLLLPLDPDAPAHTDGEEDGESAHSGGAEQPAGQKPAPTPREKPELDEK